MKKIFLIATGGTIASREGKNGLTPELSLEQLLQYVQADPGSFAGSEQYSP